MKKIEAVWSLFGEERQWTWTHGPSARDLNDHGGRVVVRPVVGSMTYNIPIGASVSKSSTGGWVVEVLRVVGTRGALESWEYADQFTLFGDAVAEAKRLVRAAIKAATGGEP